MIWTPCHGLRMSIGETFDKQLGSRITQGVLFLILVFGNIAIVGSGLMLSVAYMRVTIIIAVAWLLGVSFGKRRVYKKVDLARQNRK